MCGIVGFWDKTGDGPLPVGQIILRMLNALGSRGPDSAGVALYGPDQECGVVLRVKLGERGHFDAKGTQIAERVRALGWLREASTTAEYLRLVLDIRDDRRNQTNLRLGAQGPASGEALGTPRTLDVEPPARSVERLIESIGEGIEVVSMGRRLEIVKQVGSPQNLEATYGIAQLLGTHGLGHTRLSTESRVDLSHSQPFWAHGSPDLAIVHNGHITNYHKLRRRYEQHGVRFHTDNDSEVVGVYLAERLTQGMTLAEALQASLVDLDGSFSYLAATSEALGFAKDPFALKPLLVTETDTFVAVATEEQAIRAAFDGTYEVREAQAREVRVWQRSSAMAEPRAISTRTSNGSSQRAKLASA